MTSFLVSVPCEMKGQLFAQRCDLFLSPVMADRFTRICLRVTNLTSNRRLGNRMSVIIHSVKNI